MRLSVYGYLASLVACASLASADIYRCTDATGHPRYQDIPCTAESRPMLASEPHQSSMQPAPASVPAEAKFPAVPPAPLSQASEPVDTLQFANLDLGLSMTDVEARLGPPQQRIALPTVALRQGLHYVIATREAWLYPGTRQVMATRLVFQNGWLLSKTKDR